MAALGRTLRWATIAYGGVGVIAAWFVATIVALGLELPVLFAWAGGVTIVIAILVAWYLLVVQRGFRDATSYGWAKRRRALSRLDRVIVVGLHGEAGKWVGGAVAILGVVTFATAVVVSAFSGGESVWPWIFVCFSVGLGYAFGFVSLHVHLVESARDAAV